MIVMDEKNIPALAVAFAKSGEGYFRAHPDYPGYFLTIDGKLYSERKMRFMKPIRLGNYIGFQVVHRQQGMVKRYLHRLLLEFYTLVIPPGMCACHNDGDKTNNTLANLRWDTYSGNHMDMHVHGTAPIGEKNPMAALTDQQVIDIRKRVQAGSQQRPLCHEYNVSPMTISRIVNRKTWKHL